MPNVICHHKGKYNLYTTIADGFCYESALTLEQLEQVIKERQGSDGIARLPERLERAHIFGHSGLFGGSLNELLLCNRAGENEKHLSYEECINKFLT